MRSGGLVDLQVNGFAGVDFNAGEGLAAEGMDAALEAMLATGVTTLLPTLITASEAELAARFAALDQAVARSRLGPLMCPGYHLEGPFLNPAPGYAGCHPPAHMAAPDYALVERLERGLARPVLLVTVAPELPGSDAFIRQAVAAGKLVAVGHSAAGFSGVARAADAGASLVTHLGNGLPQMLPKLDNPVFAQLAEDRLAVSVIADGVHVPPEALKVLVRAAGPGRVVLVTDAVSAAAAPAGPHPFAGMVVTSDGRAVRQAGAPSLAGSALCLDMALRNLVAWGIAAAGDAIAMASTRPAALLAPALAAHGIALAPAELAWSDGLRLRRLRLGPVERSYRTAPPTLAPEDHHAA